MKWEKKIRQDLFQAMKAGESLRMSVLRMLLSEMNYKRIELQRELTDADVMGVMAKEVKKRREAIESFTAGGRKEQARSEQEELEILQKYLPKMMSEEEIRGEVTKITERLSDEEKKNFGQVMRVVAPALKGRAEGTAIAKVVKDLLGEK